MVEGSDWQANRSLTIRCTYNLVHEFAIPDVPPLDRSNRFQLGVPVFRRHDPRGGSVHCQVEVLRQIVLPIKRTVIVPV